MPRDPIIDLHAHSNASDGTDTPAGVVERAAEAGIDVVALTDHDTTSGWEAAAGAARREGIALVRGAEISAKHAGVSVHILSYLHDPDHEALRAQNDRVRSARTARAREMVERLGRDYAVSWDDVIAHTEIGTTIGRPHIADALVTAGYIPDRSAAFSTILAADTPYYVPHYAPDALDAIRAVRAAGGVPVFAHPGADVRGRVVPDSAVEEMVAAGLLGLEVRHRDNSPEQQARLMALADAFDLWVTGSSDYHGDGKPNRLGENTTTPAVLEQIEAAGLMEVLRPD